MAKRKKRRVKASRKVKTVKKKKTSMMKVAYLIALIGGIVTLIASGIAILFAFGITFLTVFLAAIFAKAILTLAVIGAVCGILMLYAAKNLKRQPKKSAILLLIVGIIAMIVSPLGIGGILAIIAGIIILAETSR